MSVDSVSTNPKPQTQLDGQLIQSLQPGRLGRLGWSGLTHNLPTPTQNALDV